MAEQLKTYEDLLELLKASGKTYDMDMIDRAYRLAEEAHGNQVRHSGAPYVSHPIAAACILVELGMDSESIVAGLLHDVVEDTSVTMEELEQEFPKEVTEAVRLLTRKKEMPYLDYIRPIRENPLARKVKLADLEHNLDDSRLINCKSITEEKRKAWRERYQKAKAILLEEK